MGVRSLEEQIEDLYNCKYLPENEAIDLCIKVKEILIYEDNGSIRYSWFSILLQKDVGGF